MIYNWFFFLIFLIIFIFIHAHNISYDIHLINYTFNIMNYSYTKQIKTIKIQCIQYYIILGNLHD